MKSRVRVFDRVQYQDMFIASSMPARLVAVAITVLLIACPASRGRPAHRTVGVARAVDRRTSTGGPTLPAGPLGELADVEERLEHGLLELAAARRELRTRRPSPFESAAEFASRERPSYAGRRSRAPGQARAGRRR